MTTMQLPVSDRGTSASGPMRSPASTSMVLTIMTICHVGAGAPAVAAEVSRGTSAGHPVVAMVNEAPPATSADAAIGEVRRLSGLTWEQLAELLGVSRRTLHFWASGKPMNAPNEERLHQLLGLLRAMDLGAADYNRAALLVPDAAGMRPFDMVAADEFEAARRVLGLGDTRRLTLRPLSDEARAARRPASPADLVGVLQDPVHVEPGRGRAAKSVRVRRGGERSG